MAGGALLPDAGWEWRASSVVLLVALSLVLAALIPPFQSPDEAAHLTRAYLLSKGRLLLDVPTEANSGSGGWVDDGLIEYAVIFGRVAAKADQALARDDLEKARQIRWKRSESFVNAAGSGYYLPLAYFPHAAALFVGRHADLSIDHTYRLTRFLVLLTTLGVAALAFRLYPVNPLALLLLALPMSVFQFLSPTLDGWTTGVALLAMALFMRGMVVRWNYAGWMAYLLAACVVVLACSRTHLLPLTAMPLFIYLVRRSPVNLASFLVTAVFSLGWLLFTAQSTVLGPERPALSGEILAHYASRPLDLAGVIVATLRDGPLMTFYGRSFVGILGWLDTPFDERFYRITALFLLLGAFVTVSVTALRTDWPARGALVLLALVSSLLVFVALLLTWTPHPASVISGVQGRYFLVPALMVAYALAGDDDVLGGRRALLAGPLLAAYVLFVAHAMPQVLLARFYAAP